MSPVFKIRRLLFLSTVVALAPQCAKKQGSAESQTKTTQVEPSSSGQSEALGDKAKTTLAFKKAIREGRSLAKKELYEDASAAFQRALVAVPNDPLALSELSWALLKANDLSGAIKAANASIERATGNLKAASLYNLGRGLEAADRDEAAIEAYRDSMNIRPHSAVAKRLSSLTDEVIAPLAPVKWLGPYPDIVGLCAALREDQQIDADDEAWTCKTIATQTQTFKDIAPYVEATAVVIGDEYETQGRLAAEVSSGWFTSPEPFYQLMESGMDAASGELQQAAIVAAGDVSVLRIDFSTSEDARFGSFDATRAVICGVGASKNLSCTPFIAKTIEIAEFDFVEAESDEDPEITQSVSLDIAFGVNGKLKVSGKGEVPADYSAQLGEHLLFFP